jgi:thiamine kinase-like enzyme
VEPEQVAERIWPGRKLVLEPLDGGLTNQNFRVAVDGEVVVLRIGGKDSELLAIDRSVEHGASLVASELGIGPEVVGFVEPEGYLGTRFIEGRPIPPEEMRRPETIARAATSCGASTTGPRSPVASTRFASSRSTPRPPRRTGSRSGRLRVGPRRRPSHRVGPRGARAGRLPQRLPEPELLDEDGDIRIVDWEYAGMGDRFFDLANFSINHEFDDDANAALLEAYFGELRDQDARALRLMRFMSDFREAMWGVVQQGVSDLDVDYVGWATQHFDRMLRTAAEEAFEEALKPEEE